MRLKYLIILLIGCISLQGCNDEFLDRLPLSELSEETFFNTESDLKLYANSFYTMLPVQKHDSELMSDNVVPRSLDAFLAGNYVVPNTDASWNWTTERQLNYFLKRYNKAQVDATIKNRYAAEIRFFRAYVYWRKVVRYGNVPWLNSDLTEVSQELYAPRNNHKAVMDSARADLEYAIVNLPEPEAAEQDRLNKHVAYALKARICLWEGTFRKYHSLGDHAEYLSSAASAAETLINTKKYAIFSTGNPAEDYQNLFVQEELRGNPETIFARRYIKDVSMHNTTRTITDNWYSFSKNFVNSYLCSDGLPIALSPLYRGDSHPDLETENRDPRFKQSVITRGYIMTREANGTTDRVTLPRIPSSVSGYAISKWKSPDPTQWVTNQSTLDQFIFRYAETLLIFAEAKAELGLIDQQIIDNTINWIRARVSMPAMNMATVRKDPKSDFPELPAVLDEIRRERRIELAAEGFRYDDLLRWKAGKLIENPETILGMKLTPALRQEYQASGINLEGVLVNQDNYIRIYPNIISRKWNDKMYLYPLPLQELTLNPTLAPQNPGW